MMSLRMEQRYEDALQKCLEGLVKTLPSILDLVLVKMNAYFLDHQQEVIRTQGTNVGKVMEFVKTLRTMQNEAFFNFLTVLDQLNYRHMANEIRLAANISVQAPPHSSMGSLSSAASMVPPPSTTTAGDSDIFSQKPTMTLVAKGICDYIAAHWMDIGYCLDFDADGNQVDLIENEGGRNPKKCCTLMLKTWIQGDKGKQPKTWQTLLDILLSLDLKTAHDKVKEHLQYVQSKQQMTQESTAGSQPIQETVTDSLLSSIAKPHSPGSLKRFNNNEAFHYNQQSHAGSSQD